MSSGKSSPQEKEVADVQVTTSQNGEHDYMMEKQAEGAEKFHKLGWLQLVVVLIVEAIALGSLSIPS